jgi:hypothetical protein
MDPNTARKLLDLYRATDPMHHFKASPTQQEFLNSNAYYRLVIGGNRSGKSTVCLQDLALVARGKHPSKPWRGPVRAMVFCVSRQQAALVAQQKLLRACELPGPIGQHPLIPLREIRAANILKVGGVEVSYRVDLANGSEIHFSWSDAASTWKRIQGGQLHYIYIDEAAGTKKLVRECRARLLDQQRPDNGWFGCLVWGATGTEANEAFEDFRVRAMDPAQPEYQYFQLRSNETGALDPAAVARYAASMTDDEKKIYIDGTETEGGLVRIFAKQYSDAVHLRHQDYVPGPHDNIWLGYDPGADHPTGMVFVAVSPESPSELRVVKCFNHSRETYKQDCDRVQEFLAGRRLAGVVYDNQTNAKNKFGPTLLALLREELRTRNIVPVLGWYKSYKNHEVGIAVMRDMFAARPPLITLNSSDASGGKILAFQLNQYRGKEETQFTGAGGIVKKHDDCIDALRYIAVRRLQWRHDAACGYGTVLPAGATPGVSVSRPDPKPPMKLPPPAQTPEQLMYAAKRRGKRYTAYIYGPRRDTLDRAKGSDSAT